MLVIQYFSYVNFAYFIYLFQYWIIRFGFSLIFWNGCTCTVLLNVEMVTNHMTTSHSK